MATDPKLIVSLQADLKQFERQLKQGGDIAERETRAIQNQFAATFSGSFLGALAGQLTRSIPHLLGNLVDTFERVGQAAAAAGIEMDRVFAIGGAARNIDDVSKLVEKLGLQMERIRQGETGGPLLKLLEANDVQNVRNAGQAFDALANLMQKASAAQRLLIADSVGFSRELIPFLSKGADEIRRQADSGTEAGKKLKEMAGTAETFKESWRRAAEVFQNFFLTSIGNVSTALARMVGSIADMVELIQTPGAKLREFFGLDPGTATIVPKLRQLAEGLREAATAKKELGAPPGPGVKLGIATEEETNALDRQIDSIRKRTAAINADAEAVGLSAGEHARMRAEALLMEAAIRANIPVEGEYAEKIKQTADAMGQATERLRQRSEDFRAFHDTVKFAGSEIATALDGIISKTKSFADALQDIMTSVRRSLIQGLLFGGGPLGQAFGFGAVPGGTGGLLGLLVGGAFGGARQEGGSVTPGRAFLVGERGPELFVPNQVGQIVANGGSMNVNISLAGANGDETIRQIAFDATAQGMRAALVQVPRLASAAVTDHMRRRL